MARLRAPWGLRCAQLRDGVGKLDPWLWSSLGLRHVSSPLKTPWPLHISPPWFPDLPIPLSQPPLLGSPSGLGHFLEPLSGITYLHPFLPATFFDSYPVCWLATLGPPALPAALPRFTFFPTCRRPLGQSLQLLAASTLLRLCPQFSASPALLVPEPGDPDWPGSLLV